MLNQLRSKLPPLEELLLAEKDYSSAPLDAAVLAAFTQGGRETELILTRRSQEMRSHAGEVAFPGGKVEPVDRSFVDTALRESHEEIGLIPSEVEVIGQIEALHSRQGVRVQPIVGVIDSALEFEPRTGELDAVFRVPVSFFYDEKSRTTHQFEMNDSLVEMPAFQFEEFTIWGLTAAMIVKILNEVNEEQIEQPQIRFRAK